jgi:hypothetical protein
MAHNMSAPPRSTVTFRPYGWAGATANAPPPPERTCGLERLLRADPDALLADALPDVARRMHDLRREALSRAQAQDKAAAARQIAAVRALRIGGLISLAARLAAVDPVPDAFEACEEPLEALLDCLADLAGRLPSPPAWLPALAIAETLAGGGAGSDPGSTDALAVLWVLTRVNGRTFDRDGLPHLPADLAEGGTYDLYAPCAKELP